VCQRQETAKSHIQIDNEQPYVECTGQVIVWVARATQVATKKGRRYPVDDAGVGGLGKLIETAEPAEPTTQLASAFRLSPGYWHEPEDLPELDEELDEIGDRAAGCRIVNL
jgi:hypothetical protein